MRRRSVGAVTVAVSHHFGGTSRQRCVPNSVPSVIGDRIRRNRKLRKSLTSHRAPRGWRPPPPVDLDGPTERVDRPDIDGPTERVVVEAPPASPSRRRLVVALIALVAVLATASVVYATRSGGGG